MTASYMSIGALIDIHCTTTTTFPNCHPTEQDGRDRRWRQRSAGRLSLLPVLSYLPLSGGIDDGDAGGRLIFVHKVYNSKSRLVASV